MKKVVCCIFTKNGYDRAAQGLLGAGRRLADEMGSELHAVLVGTGGDAMAEEVSGVADAVLVADFPELAEYQPEIYLTALHKICEGLDPQAILLGNETYSQEVMARLAHRLGGSAASDAQGLSVEGEFVRVTRSAYGGKAEAVIELKKTPAVAYIRARAMEPAAPRDKKGTVAKADKPELPSDPPTKIVERIVEAQEGVKLEDAALIVSGGRGLGGPEPFELLKKLAKTMGAEVSASRAACDSGWVPGSFQVGQTGKKVAPELYLAIAISGASQHLMGIADAKIIAAINTDSDAPIFGHCTFGIVEDYKKVVEPLEAKLASLLK